MNEQVWYIYQNEQQLGPFATDQLAQMIENGMVPVESYLFQVGWKNWRPIEECQEELGLSGAVNNVPPLPQTPSERRAQAPRASVKGRVVVHNNGDLVIGSGVNISSTGIFVETSDQMFTVGENLKLSVRVSDLDKPFNCSATVVRFNSDPKMPVGYGLEFVDIDPEIAKEIQDVVDRLNINDPSGKVAQ